MDLDSRIYVAGHNGLVGSAIWKNLQRLGFRNLFGKSSTDLDLRNQIQTREFIKSTRPDIVIIAAAKVGGIGANESNPYDFIADNLSIELNLIQSSIIESVPKIIFMGSSCVYPRDASQPIKEEYLLSGPLEITNKAYAIAKISGIELLNASNQQFGTKHFTVMPCNLFGGNDDYSLDKSHVLPAMIRKFHDAKVSNLESVTLWGNGTALREFLHAEDLADGMIFAMHNYKDGGLINIGSGKEISIRNLASTISRIVGFDGEIIWDETKPNGTPRKLLDNSKIFDLGWKIRSNFEERINETYREFRKSYVAKL